MFDLHEEDEIEDEDDGVEGGALLVRTRRIKGRRRRVIRRISC